MTRILQTLALTLLLTAALSLTAGQPLAASGATLIDGATLITAPVSAAPMSHLSPAPTETSSFDDVLAASCQSNQCYLTCVTKGYWAGYCIGGNCVCQSNPSGRS